MGDTYQVTGIVILAFSNSDIISVKISTSVKSIGESAFFECIKLTSVEIPASMTSIEFATFYLCSCIPMDSECKTITEDYTYKDDG